jgi:hypothetical protein
MPFCKISAMILRFEIRGCFMPCAWDSLFCTLCKTSGDGMSGEANPGSVPCRGRSSVSRRPRSKGHGGRRGGEPFLRSSIVNRSHRRTAGELGGGAEISSASNVSSEKFPIGFRRRSAVHTPCPELRARRDSPSGALRNRESMKARAYRRSSRAPSATSRAIADGPVRTRTLSESA